MLKRTFQFLMLACLSCSLCWAANDPFVGKWKLNSSKTRMFDVMKVASAGADKYSFIFEGTDSETIVTDGTDQPGLQGTTLSVAMEDTHTWKVVRKKDGRMLLTAIWTLSEDGNTLRDAFSTPQPDGSTFTIVYVYQRIAGTSGFSGNWESTSQDVITAAEMQIQLSENNGLSITLPQAIGISGSIKLDGKDYAISQDVTSSGRRIDDLTVEIIYKKKGKAVVTQELKLSSDRKTVALTVNQIGKSKPDIIVFDRE